MNIKKIIIIYEQNIYIHKKSTKVKFTLLILGEKFESTTFSLMCISGNFSDRRTARFLSLFQCIILTLMHRLRHYCPEAASFAFSSTFSSRHGHF